MKKIPQAKAVRSDYDYNEGETYRPVHPETGDPLNEDNSVYVEMKVTRVEEHSIPVMSSEKGQTIGNIVDGYIADIADEGGQIEHFSMSISDKVWKNHFRKDS